MKTIFLDCRRMQEREAAHAYLAKRLHFPAYYGKNLDALYDLLTDRGTEAEKLRIVLEHAQSWEEQSAYCQKILKVFEEAAKDCGFRLFFF